MNKKYIEYPESFDKVKYNNDYKKKHYKSISISVKPDFANLLDDFCKSANISKTELIIKAVTYCIDNNIKL